MNKQVFKVLSVVLAVALAFGLVPMGSANAATISEADITAPYTLSQKLEITDAMSAEVLSNTPNGGNVRYTYTTGVLTVKLSNEPSWNKYDHIVKINTNSKRNAYSFTGKFNNNVKVPLFVLSDGTVCGILSESNITYFGTFTGTTFNKQSTSSWEYFYQAGADKYTADEVTYTVTFDHEDLTKIEYTVTKTDGTVVTSKKQNVTSYSKGTTAIVDPYYVLQMFTSSTAGSSVQYSATLEHHIVLNEQIENNQPIIDFVNAHPILIDIKNATAFDAMDFASRADEAEAAKNAFDLLTEDLQAAIVANDFYNVDEINLIINAKALALVAPYLAADFAVTEANAASVKANIATAQTNGTYDKLTSDEQTTLNKLYYEAMARVDGTVAVDFTSDSTAVSLVDGLSYNIPTYTGFGFKKASLTASFTVDASAQDDTQCIDLDLYVRQSRRVRLNNFRIEDGKILADIDMYVAGQKWSTAKKTGFVIGTANGDTLGEFTTDKLTFSFELSPFWADKNLLQPKWTVRNENQNVEVNFKDESETQSVNLAQNLSFDLTQSYQKTTPTVHSMNIIYYDAALGKPTVDGATIKTVTDAANQGLRIQSSFTATEIPSGYELVGFGAVYTTTSSLKGQALALDTNPAVTVTAPAGTGLQTFHLNINGAADDYFAFTNFTIRSYVTYKSTVTGKTFTIYSANGDRAVNGELTRRVVDVAVAMYNQKLKTLENVDATTYPDFVSDRTTLEGVLANGVAGYEGARGRLDALLAFACKYQTLVKG